jgi:GT2 family glycosyltransferase
MTDVSIIIVSFNTAEFLKKCLLSIEKSVSSKLSLEVIVSDNGSTDDTAEIVKKEFSKVIFIANKQNLGFSKANNVAIKKSSGRYLLFLNPDTEVYPNTLEEMVKFMDENKQAGAATCRVVLPNGKLDDSCHRGFPTPWNSLCYFSGLAKLFPKTKMFGGYNLTNLDFSKTHEIDSLAGSFMLVRKIAGDEVNWWDEDYFFYGEDLDFCFMLKHKGWKIYFVPEISVLHYKGVAGGIKNISKDITTATSSTRKKAQTERFKAMRIFYKKHYENKYPWIVTRLVYFGISFKRVLSSA